VLRKDRNSNGGGVFVAIRDSIISTDIPNLDTNCEAIWANIQFANSKPLYIASFYRPQVSVGNPIDELNTSISKLMSANPRKHPNIIIGGDFNVPDINWETGETTNSKTASLHNKFLSFMFDNSLTQLVKVVTRPISNNILDLIVTSNPVLVSNIESLPGMSDHNVVLFDLNVKPTYQRKPPRKVFSFNKVDPDVLKHKVKDFANHFLDSTNPSSYPVDSNWCYIRDNLFKIMDANVPSRMTKGNRRLPWITVSIKRLLRKRDRLYKKARKSNDPKLWAVFRKHRNMVASTLEKAHKDYINNVVGDSLSENPKTFWNYVKLKRTENIGIPTLRNDQRLFTRLTRIRPMH
jgi:hypothetical protein